MKRIPVASAILFGCLAMSGEAAIAEGEFFIAAERALEDAFRAGTVTEKSFRTFPYCEASGGLAISALSLCESERNGG